MPEELHKLEHAIVTLEREVRRLKAWKDSVSAGGTIRATAIGAVVAPAGGGTGVVGSVLGAVCMWQNDSAATRNQGTVVVQNGDRTFGVTAISDDENVIGVLDDDAVANGADGRVRHVGYQSVVLVQGNVTAGHYLRSSTTAGRAEDAGADPSPTSWGIALTSYAGGAAGEVAAYVNCLASGHNSLAYGHMYGDDIAETVAVAVQDTWYELTAGLSGGHTNLITFGGNHYLAVTKAAKYLVVWSMSLETAAADDEIQGSLMVDGVVMARATARGTVVAANQPTNLSGSAILDLVADNQISLAVANSTAARDIVVEDVTVSVVLVGGL